MPMYEAHLNTIIWCTGLYDEGFYGMGPFIGEASPTRRNKMNQFFFCYDDSQYAQIASQLLFVLEGVLT